MPCPGRGRSKGLPYDAVHLQPRRDGFALRYE